VAVHLATYVTPTEKVPAPPPAGSALPSLALGEAVGFHDHHLHL
jgi:hypothetical protein